MKKKWMALVLIVSGYGVNAQTTLNGIVQNEKGEPLPYALVSSIYSKSKTTTDNNGTFSLKWIQHTYDTLEISYLGFEKYLVPIDSQNAQQALKIQLIPSEIVTDEVLVVATRVSNVSASTFQKINKAQLQERNLAADLPILLQYTPSIVSTSDAGAGVGYTAMRIRGSDATRINVTINGIPVNDSESHGVFWVNMPDLTSSLSSIQIQRGVGSSTNGAGAFGASVNLQTSQASLEPFVSTEHTVGSFQTFRNMISINSGLLNNRFNFEGRLSRIASDGYIDRSACHLQSYFLSGGYYSENSMLKALVFGGQEVTQQAWYGTPEARLKNDREGLQAVLDFSGEYSTPAQVDNLLTSDRRFNYYLYDQEVDNYEQHHTQLHYSRQLGDHFQTTLAGHYTRGKGFFEQFRIDDQWADYGLPPVRVGSDTLASSDLVRRRWLANDFFGLTYSIQYTGNPTEIVLGGAANHYDGDHFGEIIWARSAGDSFIRERYYEGKGEKTDINSFLKISRALHQKWLFYADLQVRAVLYNAEGVDQDLKTYAIDENFVFFNPKAGVHYEINPSISLYGSWAVAQREPVRSDFLDALPGSNPSQEKLQNIEAGIRGKTKNTQFEVNIFLMEYKNQLVQTGQLNDVGAAVRTNVPISFRRGVELSGTINPSKWFIWHANLALSTNKIQEFDEVVYNYGEAFDVFEEVRITHKNVNLALSPSMVAANSFSLVPSKGLHVEWLTKFVGRQFLDNTENFSRSLDPFIVQDLRLTYSIPVSLLKNFRVTLLVNNVFNHLYSSNGYTWGYFYGDSRYQQNNLYPQAGRHFLTGLSVTF